MKINLKFYALAAVLLFFALTASGCGREKKNWYETYSTVCHALGETEQGDTLTNSREALDYNYKLGQRVFEADVAITSDHVAVLRHDWASDLGQAGSFGWTEENKRIPTAQEFLNAPIYGKYTPMTLLDLFELMAKKKDLYVVLDPKYSSDVREQFSLFVNTAVENGCEKVLERVIVQLYYADMYEEVQSVYPFKNYIFTLYYIGYPGPEETGGFCMEHHIPVLVMPYTWVNTDIMDELKDYPAKLYVHTVNDAEEAGEMAGLGVSGIYTDCLLEYPPK